MKRLETIDILGIDHELAALAAEIDPAKVIVGFLDGRHLAALDVITGDGGKLAALIGREIEARGVRQPGKTAAGMIGARVRLGERRHLAAFNVQEIEIVGILADSLGHDELAAIGRNVMCGEAKLALIEARRLSGGEVGGVDIEILAIALSRGKSDRLAVCPEIAERAKAAIDSWQHQRFRQAVRADAIIGFLLIAVIVGAIDQRLAVRGPGEKSDAIAEGQLLGLAAAGRKRPELWLAGNVPAHGEGLTIRREGSTARAARQKIARNIGRVLARKADIHRFIFRRHRFERHVRAFFTAIRGFVRGRFCCRFRVLRKRGQGQQGGAKGGEKRYFHIHSSD